MPYFQKAFDTISRDFLLKTLKTFNFCEKTIEWIELLYNKNLSCVKNVEQSSEFFETERGIQQGFPVSALPVVKVAEILSTNFKQNDNIKVRIKDYEIDIA